MRSLGRTFRLVFAILLVVSVGFSLIRLMTLPSDMLEAANVIDEVSKRAASEVAAFPMYLVGFQLLLLAVLATLYFSSAGNAGEQVIYVPKYITDRQEEDETESEASETVAEDKLQNLRNAALRVNASATPFPENVREMLTATCNEVGAAVGAVYVSKFNKDVRFVEFAAGFAFHVPDSRRLTYEYGEGIAGQVAKSGKEVVIDKVPEGYIRVLSGLGNASPTHMAVLPIMGEDRLVGVIETAGFQRFDEQTLQLMREATRLMGDQMQEFVS